MIKNEMTKTAHVSIIRIFCFELASDFVLSFLIVCFSSLPLWPRLPPSVHPQILPRILAHERFDRRRVALRDVPQRVAPLLPILRVDDVAHADFEAKAMVHARGVAD